LRQARDISAKVLCFVARQLHVWHLGMRIQQELRDFTGIKSRFPRDPREGWSAVRATLLIVGDDVTGRAPVPSQLLAAAGSAGIAAALVIEAQTPRANPARAQRPAPGPASPVRTPRERKFLSMAAGGLGTLALQTFSEWGARVTAVAKASDLPARLLLSA
jgi:hypothetical protein